MGTERKERPIALRFPNPRATSSPHHSIEENERHRQEGARIMVPVVTSSPRARKEKKKGKETKKTQ
jgi:hypothetical protein